MEKIRVKRKSDGKEGYALMFYALEGAHWPTAVVAFDDGKIDDESVNELLHLENFDKTPPPPEPETLNNGDTKKRADGWYRVKYCGNWIFAEWSYSSWTVLVKERVVYSLDKDLDQIDETPINPTPEKYR
jgi:hypothetical protein